MDILETRAFRSVLLVVTIITLFIALRECSTGEASGGEERADADATAEASGTAVPDLSITAEPTAPVIVQTTSVPTAQPQNVVVYPVESGDTLNDISIRFGVSIDVILRANPSLNANNLQIGQKISLPGATMDPTALDNPSSERPDGVTVTYFVTPGDTLGLIAEEYTVTLQALLDANPTVDPAALQVGQEVIVPPIGSGFDPTELTPQPTITPIPRNFGEPLFIEIQPGDSLVAIAVAYGVTLDALMGANDITDADTIFIGQQILVPPPPAN